MHEPHKKPTGCGADANAPICLSSLTNLNGVPRSTPCPGIQLSLPHFRAAAKITKNTRKEWKKIKPKQMLKDNWNTVQMATKTLCIRVPVIVST